MHPSALISREQIQALHTQLSAVSESGDLTPPLVGVAMGQQRPDDHHDYMNDEVQPQKPAVHDYINQAVIDMVLTEPQGKVSTLSYVL